VAYDTIDQLLDRCKLVQATLHVDASGKCRSRLVAHSVAATHRHQPHSRPASGNGGSGSSNSSNRRLSPTRPTSAPSSQARAPTFGLYASTRSQLFTDAVSDASQGTAQHSTRLGGSSSDNRPSSGGSNSRRPGHMSVTPLRSEQQQQQQQQQQQHGPWDGAVDLNPGFSFRPGEL
jgi:hypothetical protein